MTVMLQVPLPTQLPPDQPVNVEPADGDAVSVTMVPYGYVSVQSPPQLMFGPVIVPAPVPAAATVIACVVSPNVAVTVVAPISVTVHVPVPEQPPPDQP